MDLTWRRLRRCRVYCCTGEKEECKHGGERGRSRHVRAWSRTAHLWGRRRGQTIRSRVSLNAWDFYQLISEPKQEKLDSLVWKRIKACHFCGAKLTLIFSGTACYRLTGVWQTSCETCGWRDSKRTITPPFPQVLNHVVSPRSLHKTDNVMEGFIVNSLPDSTPVSREEGIFGYVRPFWRRTWHDCQRKAWPSARHNGNNTPVRHPPASACWETCRFTVWLDQSIAMATAEKPHKHARADTGAHAHWRESKRNADLDLTRW